MSDKTIKSIKTKIKEYILQGISSQKGIGVESEHFVCDAGKKAVPYDILAGCMRETADRYHWELQYIDGFVLGMKCDDYYLSLEPGCQLEISIPPQKEIGRIGEIYRSFRAVWDDVLRKKGYRLIAKGVSPLVESGTSTPDDIALLPKKRYQYMDEYFKKTGKHGCYMMKATASLQISIDYSSSEDAVRKLRLLEIMTPLLALLMENTNRPVDTGKWKRHLLRQQIWNDVDAERCGYIPGSLKDGFSIEDYCEYICRKPLAVADCGQGAVPTSETAYEVYEKNRIAEEQEFIEYVLSMFFFHIRVKQYLEIRMADSVPEKRMLGYAALIKGLMYTEEGLSELEALFGHIRDIKEILQAEEAIMENGYHAVVYGTDVTALLAGLYKIATAHLNGEKEREYLRGVLTLPVFERLYCECVDITDEEHKESALAEHHYMLHSTANYHGLAVKTLYVPKLFTGEEVELFEGVVRTLDSIFDKVIREYKTSIPYRDLFEFDKRTERLILRESRYSCRVPIARLDLFYNEDTRDFKFCEFNTDGSSAMNEDREMNIALKYTKAYREFSERFCVKTFELIDSWVEEFLKLYEEYASSVLKYGTPQVAIVDFLDKGTVSEFEIFRQSFEKHGISCEICDIRELRWDGERLFSPSGMAVDAIYRRAVTSDIEKNYDEVTDFIRAVEADAVCLIGDFQTQIIHHKKLFEVLHMPQTREILTPEEASFVEDHIPFTVSLKKELMNDDLKRKVLKQKEKWIVKPWDSYGSKGVLAGVECAQKKWESYLEECMDKGYVLQEFYAPYQLKNVDLTKEEGWKNVSNLTGLFVYGGKLKGLYSRVSYDQIISTQYNEMALPTIVVG